MALSFTKQSNAEEARLGMKIFVSAHFHCPLWCNARGRLHIEEEILVPDMTMFGITRRSTCLSDRTEKSD